MSANTARIGHVALLALLLLPPVPGCGSDPEPPVSPPSAPPAPAKPAPRPDPSTIKDASPAAVLERMRTQLRLTPDPRFLLALERVDRLGGTEPAPPVVRFGEGAWQVQIGSNVIGMLPELPGFADQYAMVLGRATQLWKQKNAAPVPDAPAEPIAPVPIDHVAGLLNDIAQRWSKGERTPDDTRRAALAYALLSLDLVDDLDVGDALHAQALAAVAIAEAASGQPMAREKALLAALMGYAQSAIAIAQTLSVDDPVRQLAFAETAALTARAGDPAADDFTRAIALRALLDAGHAAELEAFVARAPDAVAGSFPALAARARAGAVVDGHLRMAYSALIAMREALGQKVAVAPALRHGAGGLRADAALSDVGTALGVTPAQLGAEADRLLAELGAQPGTAWLPADARVAYHKAQLVSALDGVVRWQLAHPDASQPAQEVTAALGAGKRPLAEQLDRYARDVVRAERNALPLDDLIKDVRELRELGPSAVARLFRRLGEKGAFGSAERQAAIAIAERCDSRIGCRALLRGIADRNLQDLVTEEALRLSLLVEAPRLDPELRLRHLRMERDHDGFLTALADVGTPAGLRASQLAAGPEWLPADQVQRAFDALLKEAPASFAVSRAYAEWLCEQKDFTRALRVLDAWLKQKHGEPAETSTARTLRARALQGAGKLQEAWAELQPLLASQDGAATARAALVRSAAGKHDEAIALGRKRLEQDPAPASVALLAQLLWQAERGDEAAALLETHAAELGAGDYSGPLARAFADAHRGRPVEQGVKAYGELLGKKLDPHGVRALIRAGEPTAEMAFRCHELLKDAELRHHDAAKGYALLRAFKGEAEARAWIEQALPADQRDGLAPHAYAFGLDPLLWELVPDPKPDHPQGAAIWRLRSAAYARSLPLRPEWKQRLDQYYATHREALDDRLGLHLLGQIDQAGVWAVLRSEEQRAACTYVFGLKAHLDGDVAQALDWYRETTDATRGGADEVQWARQALAALRAADKSVALLTTEAKADKAAREAAPPDAGTADSAEKPAAEKPATPGEGTRAAKRTGADEASGDARRAAPDGGAAAARGSGSQERTGGDARRQP